MQIPPLTDAEIDRRMAILAEAGGNITEAARRIGIARSTMQGTVARHKARTPPLESPLDVAAMQPVDYDQRNDHAPAVGEALVMAEVRKRGGTLDDLAQRVGISSGRTLDALKALKAKGVNVHEIAGVWSIERAIPTGNGNVEPYISRPDGSYKFGFISDTHLASKYCRLDVLEEMYDLFAAEGVDRVYHAGNWVDGEASFNRHDLLAHGMDGQCAYLAKHYPKRPGIVTYAIAGDDHEGWWCQREGVDIGRYAAMKMRDAGRADWIDLGYMECFIPLKHATSGAMAQLLVSHPGGGSAYATSYAVQKIIESLEGGEKPAISIFGHYHKMEFLNVRNVWCIQPGCTQDQTPFARKKKLEFAIGGGVCTARQDPRTGAIVRCAVDFLRFFNRGYTNQRWSHSGPVQHAIRTAA